MMSATPPDWRPSATLDTLRLRAAMLQGIRAFFAARQVLEVETPLLSPATIPDPYIESFATQWRPDGALTGPTLYLHTSPEFPMKRLLAAGSGPIYQVAKVFRQGELGSRHGPEFTLLEWYRPGFNHLQLMDEVAELVGEMAERLTGDCPHIGRVTYAEAFERHLGVDPHRASIDALRACAEREGIDYRPTPQEAQQRDTWLHLLLSHCIEPQLGQTHPEFLYHYPASQAALARLTDDHPPLAARFELYWRGVELCNGFHELCDSKEQRQRFCADQDTRQALGMHIPPLDEHLLAALTAGMPESAGVAVGLDRLLMLLAGKERIAEVLAFDFSRA